MTWWVVGVAAILVVLIIVILVRKQNSEDRTIKRERKLLRKSILEKQSIIDKKGEESPHNLKLEVLLMSIAYHLKGVNCYQDEIRAIIASIESLLETINSPLLVTVLGEFSSGKSTFINALINEKLLAMKDVESTATITLLKYDKHKKIRVYFKDGTEKEFDFKNNVTDLDKYTVENFKDKSNLDEIKLVRISLDKEILKHLDIADTPGYGSALNRHTETTKNFNKYSDAIIWVFNAQQFGKASEIKLLAENCKHFRPIAIVNKIDETPLKNGETYENKFKDKIAKLDGLVEKIFFVSSYNALKGNNGDGYVGSGIDKVIKYFNTEIIPKANKRKSDAILNKIIIIGEDIFKIYQLLLTEIKSKNDKIDEFNARVRAINKDKEEYSKCATMYNSDIKAKNVIDILKKIRSYFLNGAIPKNISDKTKIYLNEIEEINDSIEELKKWEKIIDQKKILLDDEYEAWESKWDEYAQKGGGLKKIWDNIAGSLIYESKERKHLNSLADQYERHKETYNIEVLQYNKIYKETFQKSEKWKEKVEDFLRTSVVTGINKTRETLESKINEINKESEVIFKLNETLKLDFNNKIIFDESIKNYFNQIPMLFPNDKKSSGTQIFKDFESIVKHLNTFKKEEVLDWNRIYTPSRIDELEIKTAKINTNLNISIANASSDNRKTKKV